MSLSIKLQKLKLNVREEHKTERKARRSNISEHCTLSLKMKMQIRHPDLPDIDFILEKTIESLLRSINLHMVPRKTVAEPLTRIISFYQ